MSTQITEAFVKQFSANVFHLSQQKGSRMRGAVRNEKQTGESGFYDRIGSVAAVKKTSRHSDTPQIDTPHTRRRVTLVDYIYADLIDKEDKIRTLIDPASDYALAAMWALGRSMDDELIEKASGSAFGGVDGGTAVVLPDASKLAATDGVATVGTNLNVLTLRRAKRKLDEADVDPSIRRYIAVNASMLSALLAETEVTSSDFNTVRALVSGEVNQFLGFTFIRTERLTRPSADFTFVRATGEIGAGDTMAAATAHRALAWAEDGLLLATARDVEGRIEERADKNYSTQVFAAMGIGTTRMEEEKVVEISAKTS